MHLNLAASVAALNARAMDSDKTQEAWHLRKEALPQVQTGSIAASQNTDHYRPTVHFTPQHGFMNDPNGLVFAYDKYHYYYQYNGDSPYAGNTTWGHAWSKDLVHWHDDAVAINNTEKGTAFSGSAVFDKDNASGLFEGDTGGIVAFYTRATKTQSQYLGYSEDEGKTFKELEKPVIASDRANFRDPQVVWHEEAQKWIMTVSVSRKHYLEFYGSKDLKRWDLLSTFGEAGLAGVDWECPNLVKTPVAGTDKHKYVLFVSINPGAQQGGSGTQYFLGDFNGTHYVPSDRQFRWLDFGKDNYALQVYSNVHVDSKPVYIGWLGNWQYVQETPTGAWRGAAILPRTFVIDKDVYGSEYLKQNVVPLESIREDGAFEIHEQLSSSQATLDIPVGKALELNLTLSHAGVPSDARPSEARAHPRFVLELGNEDGKMVDIGYDVSVAQVYVDRTTLKGFEHPLLTGKFSTALYPGTSKFSAQIIYDASTLEVYLDGGAQVGTFALYPKKALTWLRVKSVNGDADVSLVGSVLSGAIEREK